MTYERYMAEQQNKVNKKAAEKFLGSKNMWIIHNLLKFKNCVVPAELVEDDKKEEFIHALNVLTGRDIRIDTTYAVDTLGPSQNVIKNTPTYIAEFDS